MTEQSLRSKEAAWLACKPKSCCYSAFVIPSGRDVWRISRILDVPPWAFLIYFPSPQPRPDSFTLDDSGKRFRLALSKQPSRRTKTPPPCIFLLRSRNGHHRCGLGDLRPDVCRSFPSEMVDGVLCMSKNSGCTCRVWALADVDIAEETERVETRQKTYKEYCEVVALWNAQVAAEPPGTARSFFDYCNFVLETYDDIEARATQVSEMAGAR